MMFRFLGVIALTLALVATGCSSPDKEREAFFTEECKNPDSERWSEGYMFPFNQSDSDDRLDLICIEVLSVDVEDKDGKTVTIKITAWKEGVIYHDDITIESSKRSCSVPLNEARGREVWVTQMNCTIK